MNAHRGDGKFSAPEGEAALPGCGKSAVDRLEPEMLPAVLQLTEEVLDHGKLIFEGVKASGQLLSELRGILHDDRRAQAQGFPGQFTGSVSCCQVVVIEKSLHAADLHLVPDPDRIHHERVQFFFPVCLEQVIGIFRIRPAARALIAVVFLRIDSSAESVCQRGVEEQCVGAVFCPGGDAEALMKEVVKLAPAREKRAHLAQQDTQERPDLIRFAPGPDADGAHQLFLAQADPGA